jgi:protein involved in polysaccharide export with SLBB domain
VIGEVNKPGQYPYVNEMNVLNAIALAGGYTVKAIEEGVYVRRNGEAKEVYLPADSISKIYPGDVVRIESSTFWDILSVAGPLAGFASLSNLRGPY